MKLPGFLISIVLVVFISMESLQAELYKWVDDKGNTFYGDKPPENAELKKITGDISSVRTVTVEPFSFDATLISQPVAGQAKTVIMFSTSWCGYCKKAAKHFKRNDIAFTEYDIEKNRKAAREYRKLKGRGVPLILIGRQRMSGFSAKSFDRIYYRKG